MTGQPRRSSTRSGSSAPASDAAFSEQFDNRRVAGEDQHLVGARKLGEGHGGAKRAVRIEIHENLVNDHRQRLRTLSQFTNQPEPEG